METNSELTATFSGNPTVNIGYYQNPSTVTVRINGGNFSNTSFPAIFIAGENTTVEYIKGSTLTSSSSDGVINPTYKSITKC